MEMNRSSFFSNFHTNYISTSSFVRSLLYSLILCSYLDISNANNVFESLLQLPHYSKSESFRNTSSNSTTVLYIDDFGARGDGITDDTQIFLYVWKQACASTSHQKIVVPAGKSYLVGPIDFAGPCHSKVTLRISGTIVAPWNPDVWDGLDPHKWLYFHDVEKLTVEGGGIIDGMGQEWWARSCKINETNPCRHAPTALTFHKCEKLKVRNIMIVNSQQMHMAFTASTLIAASHLRILAPSHSPNTDGIHISASTHVVIKSSTIHTGDDCISIVSNSSRIRIRNILCGPGHGISIGSLGKYDSWAEVHDVKVDGAILSNTQNGVRIKTWQGGSGFVSMVTFRNIWMENVSNPIIIDQYYCDSPLPCENQTSAVNVRDIAFVGIKGTSATEEAIKFACSDNFPCTKLYLEDIQLISYTGWFTKSFCWEVYGSSSGFTYPHPCFPCNSLIIKQMALYSSIQSI